MLVEIRYWDDIYEMWSEQWNGLSDVFEIRSGAETTVTVDLYYLFCG